MKGELRNKPHSLRAPGDSMLCLESSFKPAKNPIKESGRGRTAAQCSAGQRSGGSIRADGLVPVGDQCDYPRYTTTQQARWRQLYRRQEAILSGRLADEHVAGQRSLGLTADKIPALASVSRMLEQATGWKIARVSGQLGRREFFGHLSQRIFPCTDRLRSRREMNYAATPDCFQDIFGHAPMLLHPKFAGFCQQLGQAACNCRDPQLERGLLRIFRFTVQFGLILNPGGLKIYGKCIIANSSETRRCLTPEVRKWPFLPGVAATLPSASWRVEDKVFVIHSFAELEDEFSAWAVLHGFL